ncbi:MAG: hypothetical protein A2046_09065 [Bacteroidetes bacterium GWA2_30_7]|nr:MAG: hypothetical protein A2046_09065 [Bacteroidetes bacterium GWA2_30_7]
MKKIYSTVIYFLISTILVLGGNENYPVGAKYAAMGNTGVMTPSLWSTSHNQAGLAFLKVSEVGLHYNNKFLMRELGLSSLAFAYPTKKTGTFGLNYNYFGYAKYNENKIGLSYAKMFGSSFAAGVQIDYFQTHIDEGYGNKGVPVAEIGILAQPTKGLYIGAHLFNISRAKLDDYSNEKIPTIFKIGLGYAFSEKALVCIETEKDMDYKPIFKGGIEYQLLVNLYLRTGIITNPVQNTFGIGYKMNKFKADIAFATHPVLGLSSHITLTYALSSK